MAITTFALSTALPGQSNALKSAKACRRAVVPLAGVLDTTPMLNSNCPELVSGEGILVSTLDGAGAEMRQNHLDYKFKNDFAIFFHHINKQKAEDAKKTLYISWVAFNPLKRAVTLTVNEQASYLSQPDAPFIDRAAMAEDPENLLYSGPGDRLAGDYIHGKATVGLPYSVTIPAGRLAVVRHLDVPVADLKFHHNGRSFFARGNIRGALAMATLATFSESGPPGLEKLAALLKSSGLAQPREYGKLPPTPDHYKGRFIYGRVAGVERGVKISAEHKYSLTKGGALAANFPVSSLIKGTFASGEIQSAPLLRRYSDTAYSAHGNYCVDYKIKIDLHNRDYIKRKLYVTLDCPLKTDADQLKYVEGEKAVFFRGSLKISSLNYERFYHFVLHKGEQLMPFESFEIEPGQRREVKIDLLYPPDATPPQMLKIYSPQSEAGDIDLRPVIKQGDNI